MIVNDRMHWFLSIRQLLWNLFCAGEAGDTDDGPRVATFLETEVLLVRLIVGGGLDPGEISATFRYPGDVPIRIEGSAPGVWESESLAPSRVAKLTFDKLFTRERYRSRTAMYVQLVAELRGAGAEIETKNILIQSDYVDFHIGAADRRAP
ncbi:MAG TPA: hypothetical protein VIB82_09890 [Caulobacteraceae bacterium]